MIEAINSFTEWARISCTWQIMFNLTMLFIYLIITVLVVRQKLWLDRAISEIRFTVFSLEDLQKKLSITSSPASRNTSSLDGFFWKK